MSNISAHFFKKGLSVMSAVNFWETQVPCLASRKGVMD